MKSSTIRRSTLSKESMEVIETLAKEQENEGMLGEYVRPEEQEKQHESELANKAQEIDLLWQNFKATQFNSNSPAAYILIGFLIGVVSTLVVTFGVGYASNKTVSSTLPKASLFGIEKIFTRHNQVQQEETLEEQADNAQDLAQNNNKVSIPAEEETATVQNTSTETTSAETAATNVDSSKMKKYVVKSGDTGESIMKHFYGSYSPEKAQLIMKANNLKSLDRINIDQELLIPME